MATYSQRAKELRAQMEAAVDAHRKWVLRMRTAIEDGIGSDPELSPAKASVDDRCEFGRWLDTDFPVPLRDAPIYAELKQLHAEFHQHAGDIIAGAWCGQQAAAIQEISAGSEFNALSVKLVARLQQLIDQLELWAAL